MATVKLRFLDSGHEIEIERVPFATGQLLRAHYNEVLPDKPTPPNINGSDDKNYQDPKYLLAVREREKQLDTVVWAAQQQLYAKHLISEIDADAVSKVVGDYSELGIDMRQQISKEYATMGIPFNERYVDAYIYLFYVCITNANERNLLTSAMTLGSKESEAAVKDAIQSFRG